MNADPDVLIRAWLDEGPTKLPEDVRDFITSSVRSRRARGPRSYRSWRLPAVFHTYRLAFGAAAVVAVVAGGLYLIGRTGPSPNVGGPSIPPTTVPSAVPSPTWPPGTLPLGTISLTDTWCSVVGFGDRIGPRNVDVSIALANRTAAHATFGWYSLNDGRTWDEARAWTAAANQAIADDTNLPPSDFVTELQRWEVEAGQRDYLVIAKGAAAGTRQAHRNPPGWPHRDRIVGLTRRRPEFNDPGPGPPSPRRDP
jgi:hypothetical protein